MLLNISCKKALGLKKAIFLNIIFLDALNKKGSSISVYVHFVYVFTISLTYVYLNQYQKHSNKLGVLFFSSKFLFKKSYIKFYSLLSFGEYDHMLQSTAGFLLLFNSKLWFPNNYTHRNYGIDRVREILS